MSLQKYFDNHEKVVFINDKQSSLRAIIAIHDTTLGPAFGGCRIFPYVTYLDALYDVLKLSCAMTYKAAICGFPLGGGKAVIISDQKGKTPDLLHAFAHQINLLEGLYITSDDVGSTVMDMEIIREKTPFAKGITTITGNACPATAYGVFCGIKASLHYLYGKECHLSKYSVAIQGVGSVGYKLCEYLVEEGIKVFVADIDPDALHKVKNKFNVEIVEPDQIHLVGADVFAPCALGGSINENNIYNINAKIIAGAANNQLSHNYYASILKERNILYAPDFVINAGGLIDVSLEGGNYSIANVLNATEVIYDRLIKIFLRADYLNLSTLDVAIEIAESYLNQKSRAIRNNLQKEEGYCV